MQDRERLVAEDKARLAEEEKIRENIDKVFELRAQEAYASCAKQRDRFSHLPLYALDTETLLFRPGLKVPPPVCMQYCVREGGNLRSTVLHHTECEDAAEERLAGRFVGSYVVYDMMVLANKFKHLIRLMFDAAIEGRVHDILMRQKIYDVSKGIYKQRYLRDVVNGKPYKMKVYSLDTLSRLHLGRNLEKDNWRFRYSELYNVALQDWPQGALEYAEADVEATLEIFERQEKEAEKREGSFPGIVFVDEAAQIRAELMLAIISAWGIRTDSIAINRLIESIDEDWRRARDTLRDAGILRPDNTRDTRAAQMRLAHAYRALGLQPPMTEKRGVSLSGAACLMSGDSVMEAYDKYASLLKLKSTYIDRLWEGVHTPIHTRFETLVKTGRTSSSDPNLQNMPRAEGVRECYVPRDGCVFVAVDYDKAELVSLAQICLQLPSGYSRLAERLREGFDPHLDIAAQLMGCTYEEAKIRSKTDPLVKSKWRQMAKAANFGLPGGLGAETFMLFAKSNYNVLLTLEESQYLKQTWLKTWPEMKEYLKLAAVHSSPSEFCGSLIQHGSHLQHAGLSYTQFANLNFQGLTASAAKAAGFELVRTQFCDRDNVLYGTHLVNFVHDEFIGEFPEHKAHECAQEMVRIMVEKYNEWTPDVPVTASAAMMRRWTKKAEPEYRDGRLIPWDDVHRDAA